MDLPEGDYQILKLTDLFYDTYPNPPYFEILKKRQRAYNCLLFQSHYDYFICIPFRSEITHSYAYRFRNSVRSRNHNSGLDYTKMLIIREPNYIDIQGAIIDNDEYKETMINLEVIKQEGLKFVEDYVEHIKEIQLLHPAEFRRRYNYSPLKYFHNELRI